MGAEGGERARQRIEVVCALKRNESVNWTPELCEGPKISELGEDEGEGGELFLKERGMVAVIP